MNGLWHSTEQTIHWELAGTKGSAPKESFGWSCAIRISPLNCALAERTDVHEVRVQSCKWDAKVNADHAAWWGAFFDLELFGKRIGQFGRVSKSSLGTQTSFDECSTSPGSPGG